MGTVETIRKRDYEDLKTGETLTDEQIRQRIRSHLRAGRKLVMSSNVACPPGSYEQFAGVLCRVIRRVPVQFAAENAFDGDGYVDQKATHFYHVEIVSW